MTIEDALENGRLTESLALQSTKVLQFPNDTTERFRLLELQLIAQEYHQAWDTLKSLPRDDEPLKETRRFFRNMIRAAYRRAQGRHPRFCDDIPAHARSRFRAIQDLRWNDPSQALQWIDRADHRSPHIIGHVNGREFDGIRDADDRWASILEVIVEDQYLWLPFEQIRSVTIGGAQHTFERAFRPVLIRLQNKLEFDGFLPMIYVDTTDEELLLGWDTDHVNPDGGPIRCHGAKLFHIGEEELRLDEIEQLEFKQRTP